MRSLHPIVNRSNQVLLQGNLLFLVFFSFPSAIFFFVLLSLFFSRSFFVDDYMKWP